MRLKLSDSKRIKEKDLFVFDLDGTLVETKSKMDKGMSVLMARIIESKKVAVIGGGKYEIFHELFVDELKCKKALLKNLYLFPTTATAFYKYDNGWKNVYQLKMTKVEYKRINKAFEEVFKEINYKHPKKTFGELLEHRGSQVSFSFYGQDLVRVLGAKGVRMKKEWLRDNLKLKMQIARSVGKKLPDLEVRAAGYTTIDVTRKGINKAYGIRQIRKYLKIPVNKMLFIGDAIFPGGNDYAALQSGVDYMPVKGPEDTKKLIQKLLS